MTDEAYPPSDWVVPEHALLELFAKTSSSCIIIPVINEGPRIHALLERMRKLELLDASDVILADGGSDDGSLESELLRQAGVRSKLVLSNKIGLSAQLRAAYAYALLQGYEQIVTIDGNDKDDPAAIPNMIALVRAGTSFVQGSRFVLGGQGINTPWVRDFAIRGIHAPLLSFASGHKWTDTTQGFRAYSATLLRDARLRIFRDTFNKYELLAYLSYRAPRLGFECVEVGTVRAYPKGEIPTKISKIRGNFVVFFTLIKACLGLYNPKHGRIPSSR